MENGSQKTGVSFEFKARENKKKLQKSNVGEPESDVVEAVDFIASVNDKAIKSIRPVKEVEGSLVVPLISSSTGVRKWRYGRRPDELEEDNEGAGDSQQSLVKQEIVVTGDADTDQAVNELLQAATLDMSSTDSTLTVPLLMHDGDASEGTEVDDKLHFSLGPKESSEENYEAVPVEQYGMAMLRGMGWTQGAGVGRNNKIVKPVEVARRAKGLGLGANRSFEVQTKDSKADVSGADSKGEELVMKKGAHCVVTKGDREGLYGTISSVDDCDSRVTMTMALGGDVVTYSLFKIKLVTKQEYESSRKYLNQAKVDRYNEGESKKQEKDGRDDEGRRGKGKDGHGDNREGRHGHGASRRSESRSSEADRRSESQGSSVEKKHRHKKEGHRSKRKGHERDGTVVESKRSRNGGNDEEQQIRRSDKSDRGARSNESPPSQSWLYPNLRVRVIDETYMKGKYFKEKVTIEDVVSQDCCLCRTTDGKVLEGVRQSQLETVIPRDTPSFVRIVGGKYRSELGEILSRDKSRCTACVQLLKNRDVVVTVDYEHICEYTGDIDTQFDY